MPEALRSCAASIATLIAFGRREDLGFAAFVIFLAPSGFALFVVFRWLVVLVMLVLGRLGAEVETMVADVLGDGIRHVTGEGLTRAYAAPDVG